MSELGIGPGARGDFDDIEWELYSSAREASVGYSAPDSNQDSATTSWRIVRAVRAQERRIPDQWGRR
jgi:hypothetical protein